MVGSDWNASTSSTFTTSTRLCTAIASNLNCACVNCSIAAAGGRSINCALPARSPRSVRGVNEWQPCVRLLALADPDLFLLAGRYTLLEQPPSDAFFPKCAERGARVVIGGPYNSGVLAGKGRYNYAEVPPHIAQRVEALERECASFGVSLKAAALQFVAAHPLVVSVIPGAGSASEVTDNRAALEEPIPASLWQRLKDCGLLDAGAPTPPESTDSTLGNRDRHGGLG